MATFIYAVTVLLALIVAVTHGYALLAWKRGDAGAWNLGFFLMWNTPAAIVFVAAARFWLAQFGAGAAPLTLIAVAMAPHMIILAGNVANAVGAIRAGIGRGGIALLVSWIAVTILTITLLGTVSPNTFLIRVLL
ncbi:MAG: hypothetical protein JJU21_18575 [Salinarimonas sp.]|nr:hypothetical protein [Salinarimonas sp.]